MEIESSVKELLDPLWADAVKLKIPLYLQFELTARCNLMCRMCYIASNSEENHRRELSAAKWLEIARQARDSGLMVANITGGEPLMKEDFWELHDGLTKLGVVYTLNTNGTTMTKESVKRLAQSPPFRVLVSVYGGSEDTYAKLTTHGRWFNQARAGVENLLEAGVRTLVRMTLVRDNLHELESVFNWADSLGHRLFISDYMSPRRECGETDPVGTRLNPVQMVGARSALQSLTLQRMERLISDAPQPAEPEKPMPEKTEDAPPEEGAAPEKNTPPEPYRFMTADGFGCGSGSAAGFISYDGRLLPCGMANEPSISLLDAGFHDSWQELTRLSREVPSCAECDACELSRYCVPCPPKLKSESGSFNKKSSFLCEHASLLESYYENRAHRQRV